MGTEYEEINPLTVGQTKWERENRFADWLVELPNRGLSLSTDAFLKSAKKSSYSSHESEVK